MPAKRMPGEHIRRSLVTVEMDGLEASVFAPEELERQQKLRRDLADTVIEQHYIVSTRRFDGHWFFRVEHNGEVYQLPAAVIDRIIGQRQSIIKAQRQERGKAQAEARAAKLGRVAMSDQAAAASEDLDTDPDFLRLQEGE